MTIAEIIEIPVDCNGNSTGSAVAVVEGGTMPYSYLWSDALGQNSDTAVLLSAGMYSLEVTDANGCTTNDDIEITEPDALSLSFQVIDINCFGGTDGTAEANVEGGTMPYNYQWDDANTQDMRLATELSEGTYTLVVTDANNCVIQDDINISQPTAPISANIEQTFTSCFGENN